MISALIKLHTPILPETAHDFWSDLGFSFAQSLVLTHIPLRIVPSTMGAMSEPGTNWNRVNSYFTTPYDEREAVVNLVVGGPRVVNKFHSSFLPVNIAITDRGPFGRDWTDEEIGWFEKFDEVWVRSHGALRKLPSKMINRSKVFVRNAKDSDSLDEVLRGYVRAYT